MKIYIHTLGCKVNQFESQAMETILAARSHQVVREEAADCDCYIINTCAVTGESGRKSRQAIRRLKALNPDAVIAVCGCYSQLESKSVQHLGVELVAGSHNRQRFLDELEEIFRARQQIVDVDAPLRRRDFELLPAGSLSGRTRAMLKIQDGCVNFCSYCIIPYVRGPVRSLPLREASRQAAELAGEGYRELVLTGIEIASYGRDLPEKPTLGALMQAVSQGAPGVRLHLGSLEPRIVTEDFCRELQTLPALCPHFHLSLQSGCDETLRRMNRKYDTARFRESVTLLRRFFPDCGITADVITGFPGETEEEFSETLSFLKECRFSSLHVFPYSERPGTPAAAMEGSVPKKLRQERAHLAAALGREMAEEFRRHNIGKVHSVLFEQEENGLCLGHSGNYLEIAVHGSGLRGTIADVTVTEESGDILLGTL